MITEASARPRPEPPYSCGISAASQPARVDVAVVFVRELAAQRAHGVADVGVALSGQGGRHGG